MVQGDINIKINMHGTGGIIIFTNRKFVAIPGGPKNAPKFNFVISGD